MANLRILAFSVLSVTAYAVLFAYALPRLTRHDEFDGSRCLSVIKEANYWWLPTILNKVCCLANLSFQSFWQRPEARMLALQFAYLIPIHTTMVSYESFRRTAGIARRGSWFLLLSQVISSGGTLPAYFACLERQRDSQRQPRTVGTEEMWTIWLSTVLGCLVPVYQCESTDMSYHWLTIFQLFPWWIIAFNWLGPRVIGPLLRQTPSSVPFFGIVSTLVYSSARAQRMQNRSGLTFKAIYLPSNPTSMTVVDDAHNFGILDYSFSVTGTAAYVLFLFHSSALSNTIKILLLVGTLSLVPYVGLGGGLAVLWASSVWSEDSTMH